MTKKVRLSYELSAARDAVQGAQFLAMLLRDNGLPNSEYAQETPAVLSGILILAGERLKLVCRTLEGEVNSAVLHVLHNTVEDELDDGEGLVLHSDGNSAIEEKSTMSNGGAGNENKGKPPQEPDGVGVSFSDSAFVRALNSDGTTAWQAEVDSHGNHTQADFASDGSVTVSVKGNPRQGEKGAKETVHLIATLLAAQGLIPSEFKVIHSDDEDSGIPEDGVIDCEVRSTAKTTHGKVLLKAQVVRAARGYVLRELAKHGFYQGEATVAELADLLQKTIKAKADHYRGSNLSDIHLALDAIDHQAAVAAGQIADEFKQRHGAWASTIGFAGIWLAGPTFAMRLDL